MPSLVVCRCRPAALRFLALLFAVASFGGPTNLLAQPAEPDDAPTQRRPDFLFGRPHGAVSVKGAFVFARGGSDLFDFVEDQLTVERGDFRAPAFAADLAFAVGPRLEIAFGYEYGRASVDSEYRRYVDNDRLPIEQTTSLATANLSGTLRYMLVPRGQEVSRLAWLPRGIVPFVGAGAGYMRYEFSQTGDFVDYKDLSVFPDTFRSLGWAPSVHVLGGIDLKLYRTVYLTTEARYVWADAKLREDFVGFDPIDLAGFRVTGGINLLF